MFQARNYYRMRELVFGVRTRFKSGGECFEFGVRGVEIRFLRAEFAGVRIRSYWITKVFGPWPWSRKEQGSEKAVC
jgi:hypothetical protein